MKILKSIAVAVSALVLSTSANAATINYTFTNAGQTGRLGPSQSQADIAYSGGTLDGSVGVLGGIQSWGAQYTGVYTITAYGAQGVNGSGYNGGPPYKQGGYGAVMQGDFFLAAGDMLNILVGQMGSEETVYGHQPGGGGGGTFVTTDAHAPLTVAGGGGGGGHGTYGQTDGDSGQTGTDGTQNGGSNGSGGQAQSYGGAGGGLIGNGADYSGRIFGGQSFINGGEGGFTNTWATLAVGGFGGGGGGALLAGGGGGYSGGGSTGLWADTGTAGGGGSFNDGLNQINVAGSNSGHGYVVITFDDAQLSAVPVPAAVWLFGSGLLGLVGVARRKA